jgi:flagellar biosynthesis activator protein FlaF
VNASKQAQRAYSAAHSPTRTAKSIEYEAVARITNRLRRAAHDRPQDFPALIRALHENKQLWMAFAVDLAEPANPLPSELKAQIFSLAEFTHRHSGKVMAREATVEPLLDINTAIMRGLRNGVA